MVNIAFLVFASGRLERFTVEAARVGGSVETIRTIAIPLHVFSVIFCFVLGQQLRALKNWARWVIILSAGAGLFGVLRLVVAFGSGKTSQTTLYLGGLSTFVLAYILYHLLSSDNQMVFSPRYKVVMAETSNVRVQMRVHDYVILAVFLVASIGGFYLEFS